MIKIQAGNFAIYITKQNFSSYSKILTNKFQPQLVKGTFWIIVLNDKINYFPVAIIKIQRNLQKEQV